MAVVFNDTEQPQGATYPGRWEEVGHDDVQLDAPFPTQTGQIVMVGLSTIIAAVTIISAVVIYEKNELYQTIHSVSHIIMIDGILTPLFYYGVIISALKTISKK